MRSAPAPDPTMAAVARSPRTTSQSIPPSPADEDEIASHQGNSAAEKNNSNSNSATHASTQKNDTLLSATDQALLTAPPINTPSDKDAKIAHGQSMTPLLSVTDQEVPLSHDEMPTEAIGESLHVGSDPIAMERLDENNDDDNNNNTSNQVEKGSDDQRKDDEDGSSGDDIGGTSMIMQSPLPSLSPSQESQQHHGSMDTTKETTANSQSLTKKLLASGGDIRALLLSSQPLSSLRAQTAASGDKGAEQKSTVVSEDEGMEKEDKSEEKEEKSRFVRPRRLRPAVSKKAASDGFPSAIALSYRWHPDHMQDLPIDAANMSIRAAFDTKHDEYYVFRHWRPSQGR